MTVTAATATVIMCRSITSASEPPNLQRLREYSRRRCRANYFCGSAISLVCCELPAPYDPDVVRAAYAPRATITHRIGVFCFARQKRDAFAAHHSQIGDTGLTARMFGLLLRLPPQTVRRDSFE